MTVYEIEYSCYRQGVCGTGGRSKDVVVAKNPLQAIENVRQHWQQRHGVTFEPDEFTWHQVKELQSDVRVATPET